MSGGDNREWWRGSVFDKRTVRMLTEAERLAGVRIDPSQGSYQGGAVAASAGTHDGGGAVDVKTRHLPRAQADRIVRAMRTVGFAAWYRSRSQGFSVDHIHGIAVGCPDLSAGARDQVRQYLDGRNGLKGRGPDDGPRDFPGGPGVTWEAYSTGTTTEGDDMPITDADAEKIAYAVWSLQLDNPGGGAKQAAHTLLRRAVAASEGAAGKVMNWDVPLKGGGHTDYWAMVRGIYENTAELLRR